MPKAKLCHLQDFPRSYVNLLSHWSFFLPSTAWAGRDLATLFCILTLALFVTLLQLFDLDIRADGPLYCLMVGLYFQKIIFWKILLVFKMLLDSNFIYITLKALVYL